MVCWIVEVFKVLSQDRVQQRLLIEVFMVLSQDRVQQRLLGEVFVVLSQDTVQQCLFVEVIKAFFPNRVQQRLVEQIPVWVAKALSQDRVQQRLVEHVTPVLKVSCRDRVHHRLVVLFTTTSSRRTWRKGWRRKKCWGGWSMSPSTASNTPPSAPDASAATSWLGAAGEDGSARQHEQELHPLSLP